MSADFSRSSRVFSAMNSIRPSARLLRSVVIASALLAATPLLAQQNPPADSPAADIENSKYQFEGLLTRPEFVRALPGERFYATARLDKGAKVIVVGAKNEWLKILPPEGSFSYVSRAFVEKFGNGKQGRVTAPNLLVKAGSSLQPVMWITQTRLTTKDVVEIIGEDDQFYKIRPPESAYLYLPKEAVVAQRPVGEAAKLADAVPASAGTPGTGTPTEPSAPTGPANPPVATQTPVTPTAPGATVTPGPVVSNSGGSADLVNPATRPVAELPPQPAEGNTGGSVRQYTPADALVELQALEARFVEASQLPLPQQPLVELTGDYNQIASTPGLSEAGKRITDIRLSALKARADALSQLKANQAKDAAEQEAMAARQVERQELEDHLKKVEVQRYTAVGTLRVSSLQVARVTLFRVADPQTGRTLAYVWGTEPKIAGMVDQFVGVKGAIQTDARLQFRVITPTAVEAVEPTKINSVYVAEITPPSMAPKAPTATVTPEQ